MDTIPWQKNQHTEDNLKINETKCEKASKNLPIKNRISDPKLHENHEKEASKDTLMGVKQMSLKTSKSIKPNVKGRYPQTA